MRSFPLLCAAAMVVLNTSSVMAQTQSVVRVEYKPIVFTTSETGSFIVIDDTSGNSVIKIGSEAKPVIELTSQEVLTPPEFYSPGPEGEAAVPTETDQEATRDEEIAPVTPVGLSAGNDTYDLGDGDMLIFDEGGYDTITSTISRSLEDYPDMEHLILLGKDDIDAIGNVKANRLVGNSGNNLLAGKGGADILMGGLGDDTYELEAATNDTIIDEGGIDTITSTIGRDLSDYEGIENLTLVFGQDVDGYGDDGDNVVIGNNGSNLLDGRGGHDLLDGGKGRDILIGGEGNDIFRLSDVSHSGLSDTYRDVIADFTPGEDMIDLSPIQPMEGLKFIGSDKFGGRAGQVRWFTAPGGVILEVDVNGDSKADTQIKVEPVESLSADDLIL